MCTQVVTMALRWFTKAMPTTWMLLLMFCTMLASNMPKEKALYHTCSMFPGDTVPSQTCAVFNLGTKRFQLTLTSMAHYCAVAVQAHWVAPWTLYRGTPTQKCPGSVLCFDRQESSGNCSSQCHQWWAQPWWFCIWVINKTVDQIITQPQTCEVQSDLSQNNNDKRGWENGTGIVQVQYCGCGHTKARTRPETTTIFLELVCKWYLSVSLIGLVLT